MFGGGRVRFIRTGETKQRARRAARGSAKEKIVAKLESILSDKSRIGARSPFDRIPRPTEITFSDENGVARKGKGGERERETVLRFHDRIWQRLIISNDTRVRGKRGINFGRFVVLFRTLFDYRQAFD